MQADISRDPFGLLAQVPDLPFCLLDGDPVFIQCTSQQGDEQFHSAV